MFKPKLYSASIRGLALAAALSISLPAYAAPYLTLDIFSGPPGTTFNISGGGWESGDVIKIFTGEISETPALQTEVVDGMFSIPFDIPVDTPPGHLAIIGVDSQGIQASNTFYVVPLSPSISSTGLHTPFSPIIVSGAGFGKNEQVNITLGSSAASAQADASGNFTGAELAIPNLASAVYLLTAAGELSGAKAIEYFWVDQFWPSVTPSDYYILPGHMLAFSGTGFASGEAITINNASDNSFLDSFTADTNGSFANELRVPLGFADTNKILRFSGEKSGAESELNIAFGKFWPSVSPSSWYLLPGERQTFSGAGFAPEEEISIFSGENTDPLASLLADSRGSFTDAGEVVIPLSGGGSSLAFRLVGKDSGAETSVEIAIGAFYPSLVPSSYYVLPGSSLTINAGGFAPDEEVTFRGDSLPEEKFKVDSTGAGTHVITVPFLDTVSLNLTLTGNGSGATVSTSAALGKFYPSMALSSYYSMGGAAVTVSGEGFVPQENIEVTYDGMAWGSANSDAQGNFSFSAPTPFVSAGTKVIKALGSLSKASAEATYTQAEGFFLTQNLLQLIMSWMGF